MSGKGPGASPPAVVLAFAGRDLDAALNDQRLAHGLRIVAPESLPRVRTSTFRGRAAGWSTLTFTSPDEERSAPSDLSHAAAACWRWEAAPRRLVFSGARRRVDGWSSPGVFVATPPFRAHRRRAVRSRSGEQADGRFVSRRPRTSWVGSPRPGDQPPVEDRPSHRAPGGTTTTFATKARCSPCSTAKARSSQQEPRDIATSIPVSELAQIVKGRSAARGSPKRFLDPGSVGH